MMMKHKITIIFAFITIVFSCKAQGINTIITDYILNEATYKIDNSFYSKEITSKEIRYLQQNFNAFYTELQNKYPMLDDKQMVRTIAILSAITVNDTVYAKNRIKTVEFYTTLLTSDSLTVRAIVLTPLTRYKLTDYSNEAKNNIEKLFIKENEQYLRAEIYKLAGFLQLKKAETYLIERYFNEKERVDKWNAMLSLARMDNKRAVSFCIEKLNNDISNQGEFGYPSSIEEDAYYIRQSESFNLLIEMFNNNALIRGISKPSVKGHIGFMSLGYIEMSITNKIPKEILESVDYSIKDEKTYEQRTKTIRKWLKENKKNLILNKNVY